MVELKEPWKHEGKWQAILFTIQPSLLKEFDHQMNSILKTKNRSDAIRQLITRFVENNEFDTQEIISKIKSLEDRIEVIERRICI